MAHTFRFVTGFDDQNRARMQVQSGTGPTYDATITKNSRYSAKWDGTAAGITGFDRIETQLDSRGYFSGPGPTQDYLACCYHIYIGSFPAAGNYIYLNRLYVSGGAHTYGLRITENGTVQVYNGVAGTWASSAQQISTGTWYALTWEVRRNAAGPIATVRDYTSGATVASVTHGTAVTNNTLLWFEFGPYSASRGLWYVDNFVLEFDTTAGNVEDPINLLTTKYAIGLLRPIGAGFHTGYSGTYADVDDFPHDGDTTYREQQAGGVAAFTNTLEATQQLVAQVGTIHLLFQMQFERQTGGTCSTALRLRSGATDSDSTYENSPTSYFARQRIFLTDPATSGAWTVSAVDAVQIGTARNGGTFWSRVTEVGAELLYTVSPVSRTKRVVYAHDEFDANRRIYDLESGRTLELEEVQPNVGWLRATTADLPPTDAPADAWDDETLVPIESVRYHQGQDGITLQIEPAPDRFVERLAARMQDSMGSL